MDRPEIEKEKVRDEEVVCVCGFFFFFFGGGVD